MLCYLTHVSELEISFTYYKQCEIQGFEAFLNGMKLTIFGILVIYTYFFFAVFRLNEPRSNRN